MRQCKCSHFSNALYEIYAFAAEPRSRALGRIPSGVQGFVEGVKLGGNDDSGLWGSDPMGDNFKGRARHSG